MTLTNDNVYELAARHGLELQIAEFALESGLE